MNAKLQGVYGGERTAHMVFRGEELRRRRVRIIKILFTVFVACAVAWSIFNIIGAHSIQSRQADSTTVVTEPYSKG